MGYLFTRKPGLTKRGQVGQPRESWGRVASEEGEKEMGRKGVRGENGVNTGPSNCRHILCVVNVKHQVVITATGLS